MASNPRQQPKAPSASGQQSVAQQLALLESKKQQTAQQPTTRPSPYPPGQHQKGKSTAGTGFSGKTRWDWLQLLTQIIGAFAIPISIFGLFISVIQFNQQQSSNAQQALDQQQQTTLETYLDHMSDLLLTDKLKESKPGAEARAVARARTLVALQNLNPVRKGILLRFLYEAGLIERPLAGTFPLDLGDADLGNAFLERFELQSADLHRVNLSMADLFHATLLGANLSDANLSRTNLKQAYLGGALLVDADLSGADLSKADLSGADLSKADLSGADLRGTIINQSQLDQVTSCLGTTLPNGIICHQ